MPKVHFVKAARKDQSENIKKGDSYYWWKFRYGSRQISKTRPKNSQLTQSEFLGNIYAIEEDLQALTVEDITEDRIQEIKDLLQEQADNCEEKLNNMPDQLQEGPTGELLRERSESVEEMINDLDNIEIQNDLEDCEDEDDWNQKNEDILEELKNVSYNGN